MMWRRLVRGRQAQVSGAKFRPRSVTRPQLESLEARRLLVGDSVVVFNELMYHPANDSAMPEWVELYNQHAVDIDLSRWRIAGEIDYQFAEGTIIRGRDYLVISADPTAMQLATHFSDGLGPFTGRLNNGGATLQLLDNNDRILSELSYEDGGDWPLGADGSGATLAKFDQQSDTELAANWRHSARVGGTPGAQNFGDDIVLPQSVRWVDAGDDVRVLVPTQASELPANWNARAVDDSQFLDRKLGVGFDTAAPSDVSELIDPSGDLRAPMFGVNSSAFLRADFEVPDPSAVAGLTLQVDVNSGFAAYLNGQEIGRHNAPTGDLAWNSTALAIDAISINFAANVAATSLKGHDTHVGDRMAGVVPVGGWNDVSVSKQTRLALRDDKGDVVPGLTLTTPEAFVYPGTAFDANGVSFADPGNSALLSGSIYRAVTPLEVSFAGAIPYDVFDVYVYYNMGIAHGPQTISIVDGSGADLGLSRKAAELFGGDTSFVEANAGGTNNANYVVFEDLTAATLPASFRLRASDSSLHNLAGVQFVRDGAAPTGPVVDQVEIDLTNQLAMLVAGTNVLAIQGLNGAADNGNFLVRPQLKATLPPTLIQQSPSDLVISEVAPATDDTFWLEIANLGAQPVDLGGYVLTARDSGKSFTFPAQQLPANGFVTVTETQLGFDVADGERLFFYSPQQTELLDSRQVTNRLRGRSVEHDGRWLYPDVATPGAENQFQFTHDVVINEIMYHFQPNLASADGAPYTENDEEWIELYNRGTTTVDLTGWTIRDAIAFDFPAGSQLGPGEYLVIARDREALAEKYSTITILGNYDNSLSNRDDNIVLLDAFRNPADEVHYYSGGRWGEYADGGGTSLELRNPHVDNTNAAAWATSDEGLTSQWHTYTSRRIAQPFLGEFRSTVGSPVPPRQYNDFVFGLLDAGELLLDDVHVRVTKTVDGTATDGPELIQNTTFEEDAIGAQPFRWRIGGNHHGQVVLDPDDPNNNVLHLQAMEALGYFSNSAETTFVGNRPIVIGQEYEVSFRAKWLGGSRQLNNRAWYDHIAETTPLQVTSRHGTPGARNSRYEANVGPTFRDLQQSPAVPNPDEPVTISVVAEDPNTVLAATLKWSTGGDFSAVPMTAQPGGRFTATLPGQPRGTITQFYIEALDGLGQLAMIPQAGPASGAVYEVNDNAANSAKANGIDSLRLILTAKNTQFLHANTNLMSDDFLRGTLIVNESEVYHDIGIRLRGSQHSRDTAARVGFVVELEPDRLYRGVHRRMSIDRSTRSDNTLPGPAEMIIRQFMNHAGGIPSEYGDIIYVVAPQSAHNSPADLRLAGFGDIYLNSQFENGDDSPLYELEMLFTGPSFVGNDPNNAKLHTGGPFFDYDLEDLGDDKERYRWHLHSKNNREKDDYSRIIDANQALSLPAGPEFDAAIEDVLDVDQWMRAMATKSLTMDFDGYGSVNYRHNQNIMFYVRPTDNKVIAMPWDIDGSFVTGFIPANAPIYPQQNLTTLAKLIKRPANLRLYLGHLHDMIQTTWNRDYMLPWMQHYGEKAGQNLSRNISLVEARGKHVLSQLPVQVPFDITTSESLDVGVSSTADVEGLAWINVREIRLTGSDQPLDITWKVVGASTHANGWAARIPVVAGTHSYTFAAYDFQGQLIGSDTIAVSSTAANPVAESLRITELNYNPASVTAAELAVNPQLDADDFEYLEVQNVGASSVHLLQTHFTRGIEFSFPDVQLAAGERGVVVKDRAAFAQRYGTDVRVLGEFSGGSLSNSGERLTLVDAAAQLIVDLEYGDSDPWPESADGVGASLELVDPAQTPPAEAGKVYRWRGSSEWGGTPGRAGSGPAGVVISEVVSRSEGTQLDAIELYNSTASSLDISGWYLSDNEDSLPKYRLPAGTVLAAGEYLVVSESQFNPTPQNPAPHHFALNGLEGDDVWLVIADSAGQVTRFEDHVRFGASAVDESWGRGPLGTRRFVPHSRQTLGFQNGPVRVGPLIISELQYSPDSPNAGALAIDSTLSVDDLEYLEIYNPTRERVDLAGWRIRGGAEFEFPAAAWLEPNASVLLVSFDPTDPANDSRQAAFRAQYGIDAGISLLGGLSGTWDNGGAVAELQRRGAPVPSEPDTIPYYTEDRFQYDNLAPWPLDAGNGSGRSLHRLSPVMDALEGMRWVAATPSPGSVDYGPLADGDFSANAALDAADLELLTEAIRRRSAVQLFDLNRDALVSDADLALLIRDRFQTWMGDVNLDGQFNSADFVHVFAVGKYEDRWALNAAWTEGDWNADGDFTSSDLVVAFQDGGYEQGQRPPNEDLRGDLDGDQRISALDLDLLSAAVRAGAGPATMDLNGDGTVNRFDRSEWVEQIAYSFVGDSNLDRRFNSSDLVLVFQAGEYEDLLPLNSGWAAGDWNGDGDVNTQDLVLALQEGRYDNPAGAKQIRARDRVFAGLF